MQYQCKPGRTAHFPPRPRYLAFSRSWLVVEWDEKAVQNFFSLSLFPWKPGKWSWCDACTELEGGYVWKMTCNPSRAPRFLPDGIPFSRPVVFIFDNTLKYIHLRGEWPLLHGSLHAAGVAEPGALVQRNHAFWAWLSPAGGKLQASIITSLADCTFVTHSHCCDWEIGIDGNKKCSGL